MVVVLIATCYTSLEVPNVYIRSMASRVKYGMKERESSSSMYTLKVERRFG